MDSQDREAFNLDNEDFNSHELDEELGEDGTLSLLEYGVLPSGSDPSFSFRLTGDGSPSAVGSIYGSSITSRIPYRQYIMRIADHTCRRNTLKFLVTWGPSALVEWVWVEELSDFSSDIRDYLIALSHGSPRRYRNLLQRYPALDRVL